MTPRHQAARGYAQQQRLLLIPLEEKEKRPAFKTGPNHQTLATHNVDTIDGWWQHRDYNIGLPCTPNRLAVIDVDGQHGQQHLDELEQQHGPLPATWMQTSDRDDRPSVQFIYRWPNGEMVPTSRISEQLEVRAHGAQIVVAPSIHPTGSTYRWLIPPTDLPEGPPELPLWVLEELTRPKEQPERPKAPSTTHHGVTLAERRLDGLVATVARAPEGQRNQTLNHAAYTAARIPGLTDHEIADRLTAAAHTAGLEPQETQATIRSGIEAGHKDGPDPEHIEPGSIGIKLPDRDPAPVEDAEPHSEWTPVDLRPLLDGTVEHLDPPPTVLNRDDGISLLYQGELNWLSGEPETGKSWLAQLAAAQEIRKGNRVLYLDLEDTPSRIVDRLRGLGIDHDTIADRFHYIRPAVAANTADTQALIELAHKCSLAVIDGTTDLHLIHGLDPEANRDVAVLVSQLLRPLANAGPAVLPLDHVTKNKETRGRYAIGGQHKLAAVRGAAYHLETIIPMGRGVVGQARLFITKDRPGHIRGLHTLRQGVAKHNAGDFYLDATTPALDLRIAPPTEAKEYAEATRRQDIVEYVERRYHDLGHGLSLNKIHQGVGGNKDATFELIKQMAKDGEITETHAGAYPTYCPGGPLE
jgi:hypothetical protein